MTRPAHALQLWESGRSKDQQDITAIGSVSPRAACQENELVALLPSVFVPCVICLVVLLVVVCGRGEVSFYDSTRRIVAVVLGRVLLSLIVVVLKLF